MTGFLQKFWTGLAGAIKTRSRHEHTATGPEKIVLQTNWSDCFWNQTNQKMHELFLVAANSLKHKNSVDVYYVKNITVSVAKFKLTWSLIDQFMLPYLSLDSKIRSRNNSWYCYRTVYCITKRIKFFSVETQHFKFDKNIALWYTMYIVCPVPGALNRTPPKLPLHAFQTLIMALQNPDTLQNSQSYASQTLIFHPELSFVAAVTLRFFYSINCQKHQSDWQF